MSPVATETPTPGWGLGATPAYTVIYTGKLHHDRGRYRRRFWQSPSFPPVTLSRGRAHALLRDHLEEREHAYG